MPGTTGQTAGRCWWCSACRSLMRCRCGQQAPEVHLLHLSNISSEETNDPGEIAMKAIVVTDQAAGKAGMKLVERPEPRAAINDVIVQIHASGYVPTETEWPS